MTDISERRYDILQWPQCTIWRSVLYDYVRQFLDKGDCWVLMLRLALGALSPVGERHTITFAPKSKCTVWRSVLYDPTADVFAPARDITS